ncbi:MAG: hypothetical protein ABI571_02340, partial [Actinomycetota bacterium]
ARGVTLEVVTADGIQVEALSTQPTRQRGDRTEITLGDLTSEEAVSVVLRLEFPYGQLGDRLGAVLSIEDRDGAFREDSVKLAWEYAVDRENDVQERAVEVDRAVAAIFAARARQEAVGCNRRGDFDGARHVVKATARRIRGYAGRDQELRRILAELEQETEVMAAPMMEMERKGVFFASENMLRSRAFDGSAVKARPGLDRQ